jgi:hypothetical protein
MTYKIYNDSIRHANRQEQWTYTSFRKNKNLVEFIFPPLDKTMNKGSQFKLCQLLYLLGNSE